MAELKNEFSWSKTRDEMFRKCPRRYYFKYYGSWGGWEPDCDDRTRKLYILKKLTTRPMWAGSKVHDCIKRSLKNIHSGIDPMPGNDAIETTIAIMRKDFANSRRGDYWRNPKTCGFIEHEHAMEVPDGAWKETADHVAGCLRTFYKSDVYTMIRSLPADRWLEVEDFSHFRLVSDKDDDGEGIKIHVVLDFSYHDRDGNVVIYDWKTGRSDTKRNETQLACYSFYATQRWKAAPEQVTTIEFNLANGRKSPYHLKGIGLDAIRQYMTASIRDMRTQLDDASMNKASEERFAMTAGEAECRWCNFMTICPKDAVCPKGRGGT